jgi:hypothetical protein
MCSSIYCEAEVQYVYCYLPQSLYYYYSLALLITQLYYKYNMGNGIGGDINVFLSVSPNTIRDPANLFWATNETDYNSA